MMATAPVYLGIDGGGTKTDLVLLDADGELLSRRQGPTSNRSVVGLEEAARRLASLITEACNEASVAIPVASGWVGLAGADRKDDHVAFANSLASYVHDLRITNDAELVLSGTPDGVGIALVSGTGSIAFARNEQGESGRSGGWGHIFGDEGSAYVLAVDSLRAVAAAVDGRGPATALTDALMGFWHAETPQHLILRVYDPAVKKSDIAASAPVIVETARAGDVMACKLLGHAGDALAALVLSLARRIPFATPPTVACTGGLLLRSADIRNRVIEHLDPTQVQPGLLLIDDIAFSAAHAVRRFATKGQS